MSNHWKRINYSGEQKVAILRTHFVEGLLQEHVQLKRANRAQWEHRPQDPQFPRFDCTQQARRSYPSPTSFPSPSNFRSFICAGRDCD